MVPLTQSWVGAVSRFSSERGTAVPEVVTVDGRSSRRGAELLRCSISPQQVTWAVLGKQGALSASVYKRPAHRGPVC